MNMTRCYGFMFTAFALATAFVEGSPQAKVPEFFSTKRISAAPPAELKGRGVKRIRPVALNGGVLKTPKGPQRLTMNFFPGVNFVVNWTTVEKGNQSDLVWRGKVEGM